MNLLKRLQAERRALLKKAKRAKREALQMMAHIRVIQKIEKGFGKVSGGQRRKKRSAAVRKRMARAQRKRWATKKIEDKL